MGNTQIISFNVEPEDFNKVLERIDAIAVEQKSSRSAVFRDILRASQKSKRFYNWII